MTIASVRIYFYAATMERELKVSANHWGFSKLFDRRLKPIRESLRGPEVKGVDIMKLMLCENPDHALPQNQRHWIENSRQFSFVCDLQPLKNHPAIDNILKLMRFYAVVADGAPWPQASAVAHPLRQPLSGADRISHLPYLQWPRGEMIIETKVKRCIKNANRHLKL